MKHCIIGAGAAGVSAARAILTAKPQDNVIIISQDEKSYSRCMLHKVIAGERDAAGISFVNDDILKKVEWIKGKTVTRIDAAKNIYAGDEAVAGADAVLIATGSNSVTPPIGELKTAKNVFGLRHLSDAEGIAAKAKTAKKVVVIGSGLVGLDAVYGILEQSRASIDVIEMAQVPLAINLDAHAAAEYQKRFEAKGVKFHLACKVVNTKGDGAGNVTAIEYEDAGVVKTAECDMAVLAVGVRPAAIDGVELTERRAVKVDDRLATSVSGVYAAGDAAGLSGIWPNAQKQGQIAGLNMTGANLVYDDRFALKNTINFFGLVSLSLGLINPQDGDQTFVREDRNNYRKLILRDGVPVGIILQGEIGGAGFWQYLIKNKIRIDKLGISPWQAHYADFYSTTPTGEYRWAV